MKTTVSLQRSEKHSISASVQSWMNRSNGLLSVIMDDYITNRQALLIINALLSLALMVAFAASSPVVVLALAGWLLVSLNLCKKGGVE